MIIKRLVLASLMTLTASASLAGVETFTSKNISGSSTFVYPRLDLNGLNGIDIKVESTQIPGTPESETVIKRVELKFPNANNVIAKNLVKSPTSPDTYQAIVNSPWVFKKILVEVSGYQLSNEQNIDYRIMVVDNFSSNNALAEAEGENVLTGSATLVDTTRAKVVDVARTKVAGKNLVLKLQQRVKNNKIQIQAVWMGHGTEVLTIDAPFGDFTPKSVSINPAGEDSALEVVLVDNNGYEQTAFNPSLTSLLEQAFGPIGQ